MKFDFLPIRNIQPQGWLKKQLEIQADGLLGNLDKIWPDVRDSKWLGGDREGWERLPYFLDGFIPLAYLLRDEDKIARAKKYVYAILEGQDEEGRFRPKNDTDAQSGDIWSLFLVMKVLTVYADCSGDDFVEGAISRGLQYIEAYTNGWTLQNWAAARWFECLIPILWLYRRKPEKWLIRLAYKLKAQGISYESAMLLYDEIKEKWNYETHVVNVAMSLKSDALYRELIGGEQGDFAEKLCYVLAKYHGTAYGHFTGDECLSGTSPSQGSELCGIVEAMYSYEWLTAITGCAKWGDCLEKVAFNGLPATISADMWTHQYDQQVNQIACLHLENHLFRTNGPDANMFGLEPNYGCCTANFGQGWPKFASSAYMANGDSLAIISPVPAKVTLNGVTVECISEYPFRNCFNLSADGDMQCLLRIPAWANVVCNENNCVKDGWMTVQLSKDKPVCVEFGAEPKLVERPDGRKCLEYGALLFALPIQAEETKYEYEQNGVIRQYPYCDYSYRPTEEWRYAFTGEQFEVVEREYNLPFDRNHPPLQIRTRLIPVEWDYIEGYEYFAQPNSSDQIVGDSVEKMLQPYGSTTLRVTEMRKL